MEQKRLEHGRALLRKADQVCVATLTACALLAIVLMWIYRGGHNGRLIDIERAAPRPVQFQLDINAADWPEWILLPGIGEMLARRIVDSREERGLFAKHEDLQRVKGIGPKKLAAIRPYLLPVPVPAEESVASSQVSE